MSCSDLTPVFELRQVTQRFDRFLALHDISLQIYPGERVALVGASGAGKSTLLRLLNGTLLPTQGEVWALGQPFGRSARQRRFVQRQIGTIYQQFHLVDSLRVIHNVNAGHLGRWSVLRAALSLIYPLEVKTAAHALYRVGIPEKLYARTDQLSGGQQQRVAIARVLVQDPRAILADEPVSSLDPERSRDVMDLLRMLVQEAGKTLVVSLHSVELARSHCDRMIGLRDGKILFDASPNSVSAEMIAALYRLEG
jgi:phosphonate transport system ATP-binding protein